MTTDPTRAPEFATPVYLGGSNFTNLTTNDYFQLVSGSSVFTGLTINTAGTGSSVVFYDGKSSTVTMTKASPAVITWAAHGLVAGDAVKFTTTGALYTGLTVGTTYYVSTAGLTTDEFEVADTQAHALAGTNSVVTTGSESGVQTAWLVSNPIGTFDTTAQANLSIGNNGAILTNGLVAITAASGSAADLTVYWR